MRLSRALIGIGLLLGVSGEAYADGTLTGAITDTGGLPLAGMEVRAWRLMAGSVGYGIQVMTLTDGAGDYTLIVPPDDYKVDARMPPGFTGNYGDRWYDIAPPNGNGYIGEDADIITVPDLTTVSGIDITLEILGGFDGRVVEASATGVTGAWVRAERNSEVRIHHNDLTDTGLGRDGMFSMRGMVPGTDYQLIIYDPTGIYDTAPVAGPFTVITNMNGMLGDFIVNPYAPDMYEPNDAPMCAPPAVDYTGFAMIPPVPWITTTAYIGPAAANDVDWLCVDAMAGDRFLISVTTEFSFGGATRYHPWTDPILSFWSGDGSTLFMNDDDSGIGPLDPFLDTGPVASAGCYCAVVSTFGDTGDGLWDGVGQQSTGDFVLRIDMGNRPPQLVATESGIPVPVPPAAITIDELDTLTIDFTYVDPDADPITPTEAHTDNGGAPVTGGTFSFAGGTGSYVWTAGATAASGSPYDILLATADAEFITTVPIVVIVNGINIPPTVPTLIAPPDGSTVASMTPMLEIGNSTDGDGDPLSYEIELYYTDTTGPAAQALTVPEGAGGMTTTMPAAIAENTLVFWRARATDGLPGGFSPWTVYWSFTIDIANDPPVTPVLTKPVEGETVLVRRPGTSANNTTDAEGDAIEYYFEVASDSDFTNVVASSPAIPMDILGTTTMWAVDVDLDWGESYFARCYAMDDRGGQSGYSNVNMFRLKENLQPTTPVIEDPVACQNQVYTDSAPSSFTVSNVTDPEGESVVFELEIFDFDDDPATATPLVTASVQQDSTQMSTEIPFDNSALVEDGHYRYRIRAFDGTDYSDWVECDFWINTVGPPAVMIIEPEEGAEFSRNTDEVVVVVTNPAGGDYQLAFCAVPGEDPSACDPSPSTWSIVPLDGGDETDWPMAVSEGETWAVSVCAIDASGTCGPADSTYFTITSEGGCGCRIGRSTGAGSGGAAVLLLLLLAPTTAWARRRRRHHRVRD